MMMYRFSSVLALLLLIASGQAMATDYFSAVTALTHADFTDGTKWTTACGSAAGTGAITLGATDTFTICSGHTLTVGAAYTLPTVTSAAAITVATGGTLTATSTNKLTLTANAGIVNNGTITLSNMTNTAITLSGTGTYSGSGVLNSSCSCNLAANNVWTGATTWGTAATDRCGVTVGGGSAPLPSAGSTVIIAGAQSITGGTGTITRLWMTNMGSRLVLSGPLTVGVIDITNAGAILTGTGQTITLTDRMALAAATNIAGAPNLILTDADHLQLDFAGTLTVGALTLNPLTAQRTIKLNGATSAITATTVTGFATCSSAASPVVAAGALVSPIASTNGGAGYVCTATPAGGVSAPIFSTKEKPMVFSEEVKH